MKSLTASQPSDTLPSGLGEKQLLLDCLLQDPKRAWLRYLGERQALRAGILLSLAQNEFLYSSHRKA
jgi:hypothetical protein